MFDKGFLGYALAALVVALVVELANQYDRRAAVTLAVLVVLGILIANADAVSELAYPHRYTEGATVAPKKG